MSTDNIETEAEAARKALGQLAGAVQRRVREVHAKRDGLQKQRNTVVVGARAAMRSIDDKDALLVEEQGQLEEILHGPPDPEPASSPSGSQASVAAPPPAPPAPAPSTQPPAPAPVMPDPDPIGPPTAQVPPWGGHPAYPPAGLLSHESYPRRQRRQRTNRLNVWRWGWAAWTLAIIVAIIGMVAGSLSRHWPGMTGAGATAFAIVWIIFFTGFGFCLGGWLGDWWERPEGDD